MSIDESVKGILLTIIIDSLICLNLLLLFSKFRTKRAPPANMKGPHAFVRRAYINEKELSFTCVIDKLREVKDKEIIEKLGRDPFAYISFNRLGYTVVSILAVLGLGVLIPLYSVGNSDVRNDMDSIGISHAISQGELLATPVVFLFLFSICLYYSIYRYTKLSLSKASKENVKPISEFTIWVWGLPKDRSAASMQQEFDRIVRKHAEEGCVEFTYIVPDYTLSYKQHLKILKYEEKLTYYTQYEQSFNTRQTRRVSLFNKSDCIKLYQQKYEEASSKFHQYLNQASTYSTGTAFIVFKTIPAKVSFQTYFYSETNELNSKYWELKDGPDPNEIKWENLSSNMTVMKYVRMGLTLIFSFIFLFVVTPSFFLKYIDIILSETTYGSFLLGFLNQFLPPILMILYQLVIIPFFVKLFVKFERHVVVSKELVSSFQKFTIFFVFYLFLVPALGLSFMNTIIQFRLGNESFVEAMSVGITSAGQYLLTFIIHQTLLSLPIDLLDPGRLISVAIKSKKAITHEQKAKAYDIAEYPWAYQYAIGYTIFMIVICMSIVYPLILSAGLVYFLARYFVDKYWILCDSYVKVNNTSIEIPFTLLKALLVLVFMFQFMTGMVFLISESNEIRGFGAYIATMSILALIAMCFLLKRSLQKLREVDYDDKSGMLGMHHFPKQYIHPIEDKLAALDENYREELSRRTISASHSVIVPQRRSVNNEVSEDLKEVLDQPEQSIYPTFHESISYEGDIEHEQAELSAPQSGKGLYPSL